MTPVLGEKLNQAGSVLKFGDIAVEIEPVEGFELERNVAIEQVTDIERLFHGST